MSIHAIVVFFLLLKTVTYIAGPSIDDGDDVDHENDIKQQNILEDDDENDNDFQKSKYHYLQDNLFESPTQTTLLQMHIGL